MRVVCCALSLVFSLYAISQTDPTRPPASLLVQQAEEKQEMPELALPVVTGVMKKGETYFVMIGDMMLEEGQQWRQFEVISVQQESVEFKGPEGTVAVPVDQNGTFKKVKQDDS